MLLHAYRRTLPHPVEIDGEIFEFKADDKGRQVCDVPEGPALERLLSLREGYQPLDFPLPEMEAEPESDDPSPFLITDGDTTIDLRKLTKAELTKFAADNELTIDGRMGVEKLRQAIVDELNRVE